METEAEKKLKARAELQRLFWCDDRKEEEVWGSWMDDDEILPYYSFVNKFLNQDGVYVRLYRFNSDVAVPQMHTIMFNAFIDSEAPPSYQPSNKLVFHAIFDMKLNIDGYLIPTQLKKPMSIPEDKEILGLNILNHVIKILESEGNTVS